MKRFTAFYFLLAWAMAPVAFAEVDDAVIKAQAQRIAVVQKAKATAVAIFARGGRGGGSGVVITPDGYALTNFHVTRGAGTAMKCGMADGKLYDAVIVGIDPVGDVALIKLFGRDDFPCAELADSDLVAVGDNSFAVGNPFLLATDFQPTVTFGMISGVHRYQYPAGTLLEYADCIQTDASINPGNSGGPLFNAQGQLIGINGRGSFEKRGRVNVGVGYAISINQIKNFLGCLHAGRIVDHATLGARVGTDEGGRVLVADILEDCDAFRRGLRYDDEVVGFAGRPIHTTNAFKNALGIYPIGWRIPLSYKRGTETFNTLARLSGVHSHEELLKKIQGRSAPQLPTPKKPGDKPDDGKPDDKKPNDEKPDDENPRGEKPKFDPHRIPIPGPGPEPDDVQQVQKPEPMPEIVKKHYKEKHGFANYYFNELNRDRVWKAFVQRGDFSGLSGTWVVGGQLVPGGDARFEITGKSVACSLPGGQLELQVGDDLTDASDPPGSGGLLAALALWRRLLEVGPTQFGGLYYMGTQPLARHTGLVDTLIGTYGGVECHFSFDPDRGDLLAVEMFLHDDEDPCELYFSDHAEHEGRWLPRHLEVRYGNAVYAVFDLNQWAFSPAAEE